MNVLDRIIGFVSPEAAAKRVAMRAYTKQAEQIMNTGYSNAGASYTKKSLRGMTGISASPQLDIDGNLWTLVNRSRMLYMSSPIATSAIKTNKTNVVGAGLKLKSRIDFEFLGLTEEEADEWESAVEREFALWADTRECDALRLNNFYEMQALVLTGELMNGDAFALLKFDQPSWDMPYALRVQLIESDRICTPYSFGLPLAGSATPFWGRNPDNGNTIYSGVEIDDGGATVAYWLCNQYPYAMAGYAFGAPTWERIPARGDLSGRPNVLHIFEAERAEQRRGVPILAPVIEELQQLKRYEQAELMAAVVSSLFTAFVTTESPQTTMPLGQAIPDGAAPIYQNDTEYSLGNGAVVSLAPGESVSFADPKRPATAFDGFVDAVSKTIGAGLEIPSDLLLKKFNASYSASRAALLEAWKAFQSRRQWLAKEFCEPVYRQFLIEAVARGRIEAPGFFDDPIRQKAWCGADWNGPAQGMLDPTKEVQAAQQRVENGFSTREEETIGLTGGNFKQNARQLRRENEMLQKANASAGEEVIPNAK